MTAFEVRDGRALGSRLRLTVGRPGGAPVEGRTEPAHVDLAWAAVAEAFDQVDRTMSRFRDDSELTLLNRRLPSPAPALIPSRMLAAALALADRACRVTDGRFDARIVGDLERLGAGGVPQGVASPVPRGPGSPLVRRAGRGAALQLLAPADLGGLGKGLALRWSARRAQAILGDTPFLLDAGGDIVTRGVPEVGENAGWSIGIEDPAPAADGAAPVATVELRPDQSIATSSVRIGRWAAPDGRPVHHLIDPRTGQPGGGSLRAVTVAWSDPAWAEVWSKALFLEGPEGIANVARRRGLPAWWIDADGELSMTPAARVQTTWVRAEATSAA